MVWCLLMEVLQACAAVRQPRGRPWTHQRCYLAYLSEKHFKVSQEGLKNVARRMPRIPCLRADTRLWTSRRWCGWELENMLRHTRLALVHWVTSDEHLKSLFVRAGHCEANSAYCTMFVTKCDFFIPGSFSFFSIIWNGNFGMDR